MTCHFIILWECFRISFMPKLFHLFTAKNNSSLHWQCICIIFGDNDLESLYCQKTLISLMTMHFGLLDANAFKSLHCQCSCCTLMQTLVQLVRFFLQISSLTFDLLYSGVCSFISLILWCSWSDDNVFASLLEIVWKENLEKREKLFWIFSVQSLWNFSLFFFGFFFEKILREKVEKWKREKLILCYI